MNRSWASWARLAACAAVVALGGCASTVSFDSAKLYENDEKASIRGYFFKPEGAGPFPAVVLLHTNGGVRPHVSSDWPQFLTAEGYAVLTVDTNGSRGLKPDRLPKQDFLYTDAYGALDYLATRPDIDASRIAVMGFSSGAIAVQERIMTFQPRKPGERNFKAAVGVYGPCRTLGRQHAGYMPLFIVVAEHDRLGDSCRWLLKDKVFEGVLLKGAYHAFDMAGEPPADAHGNKMRYSAEATAQARAAVKDFLARHLKR